MDRKVYVNVTTRLIIRVSEGQDIDEVLQNMDYSFTASESDEATIEDTEITDWEVVDSKRPSSYQVSSSPRTRGQSEISRILLGDTKAMPLSCKAVTMADGIWWKPHPPPRR